MTEGSAPKHGAKVIYFFILYFFYMIFLFSQFNHHNKLTTNSYTKTPTIFLTNLYTSPWYHFSYPTVTFCQKIYPKGPENGRTVQMNCESVGSDFQAIWQKILKRQVYANFGQSSVTKTLPSPLKARIGKSGNE